MAPTGEYSILALTNATKYTPPGGTIRVCVTSEDDRAVVRVKDTGVGIPAELLPRAFDLLTQGQPRLERMHGSLCVGLTLVRRLVDLHPGRIEASGDGPGRGSEFVVRLPSISPALVDAEPIITAGRPETSGVRS
jgi:signal transduction histidine kinase